MSKKFRMLNEQDLESSIDESKIRSGWGNNFFIFDENENPLF